MRSTFKFEYATKINYPDPNVEFYLAIYRITWYWIVISLYILKGGLRSQTGLEIWFNPGQFLFDAIFAMGQAQGLKKEDNQDKNKKEKKPKPRWSKKDEFVSDLVFSHLGTMVKVTDSVYKLGSSRKNEEKKKKELQHDGHFEIRQKYKSNIQPETSLGLFYCLPNEILASLTEYLSWKEALVLQTCSRGLFVLLDEDLYWAGLYEKIQWRTPEPVPEVNRETNEPIEECCYKKKFFSRYLTTKEKIARYTVEMDAAYQKLRAVSEQKDKEIADYERMYNKDKEKMDRQRWWIALASVLLLALFAKPATVFLIRLFIWAMQLPADIMIVFTEKFSCWKGNTVITCWGFDSRRHFNSIDELNLSGLKNDYAFCMPNYFTFKCTVNMAFWVLFQLGKVFFTAIAVYLIYRTILNYSYRLSDIYLKKLKFFSQEEINTRITMQKQSVHNKYEKELKELREIVDKWSALKNKVCASTSKSWNCCVQ